MSFLAPTAGAGRDRRGAVGPRRPVQRPLRASTVLLVLALVLLLAAADSAFGPSLEAADTGGPTTDRGWCGAHPARLAESLAVHRSFTRRARREALRSMHGDATAGGQGAAADGGPRVRQVGHVAVIEDDGSLVSQPNPMDLSGATIRFKRRGRRIRAEDAAGGVGPAGGDRLDLGDDDSEEIALPFDFDFFGRTHRSVHVNSDGNLTFGTGDSESTARSVARLLNGPPRVAAFFADLDPSESSGDSGVFVEIESSSLRVTWKKVPEFGKANENTFRATLYATGRVELAWAGMDGREGVVGVSPGGGTPLALVDLSDGLPVGPTALAVLERFSISREVDDFGVAETFLDHFVDEYSHVIVWLDFVNPLDGAYAYEFTLKNRIEGLGLSLYDFSALAGSTGALESFVQMGTLRNRYLPNPNANVLGTNSTLDVVGHEAGHRWMAFTRFDGGGFASPSLLGRNLAHWSFHFDTDASVMEGNDLRDNGDGSFTTVAATSRYSNLDRYLMGLIPAEEVGGFFYVRGALGMPAASPPEIGETIFGTRQDLTVADIVEVEGPRVPAAGDAPKTFKMAFVLLGRQGEPPSPASIAQVQKIRKKWAGYFKRASGRQGRVVTKLVPLEE